jgi:hypothetical protein
VFTNVSHTFLLKVMHSSWNAIWSTCAHWKSSFLFQSLVYLFYKDLHFILPNSFHRLRELFFLVKSNQHSTYNLQRDLLIIDVH